MSVRSYTIPALLTVGWLAIATNAYSKPAQAPCPPQAPMGELIDDTKPTPPPAPIACGCGCADGWRCTCGTQCPCSKAKMSKPRKPLVQYIKAPQRTIQQPLIRYIQQPVQERMTPVSYIQEEQPIPYIRSPMMPMQRTSRMSYRGNAPINCGPRG